MSAFMVIRATISDPQRFRAYAQAVPAIVARYGGRYRVLGTDGETLEGEADPARTVISEWPDMESARRFWNSPEYRDAKRLREGTGRFSVKLFEGTRGDDDE